MSSKKLKKSDQPTKSKATTGFPIVKGGATFYGPAPLSHPLYQLGSLVSFRSGPAGRASGDQARPAKPLARS